MSPKFRAFFNTIIDIVGEVLTIIVASVLIVLIAVLAGILAAYKRIAREHQKDFNDKQMKGDL